MPKLLIVEANEVPPRVFREFARLRPASMIAQLLDRRPLIETEARDVPEKFLYPSQSWASFNTGLPYGQHNIHWYNDVKDYSNFYWHDVARRGHSTIVVNALHSSPLRAFVGQGNYKLVIPDCFAPDDDTFPSRFRDFQKFNTAMAVVNGRKSFLRDTLSAAAMSFLRSPSPSSWGLDIASTSGLIAIGTALLRGSPERLRSAQFPLLASIFFKGLAEHLPDLGVLFTNHVASMMHRYWFAAFPEDFGRSVYSAQWIERYQGEIVAAMELLDGWIEKFDRFARRHGYTLIVSSSMGQAANADIMLDGHVQQKVDYRIADPQKFIATLLDAQQPPAFESAMVPQYTFAFATDAEASAATNRLRSIALDGIKLHVDQSGNKITTSVSVDAGAAATVVINGRQVPVSDLGIIVFDIDDHHSGRHHPIGSILVSNDTTGHFTPWQGRIDYLSYAPAVRRFFG
jgi:hypothetical protein